MAITGARPASNVSDLHVHFDAQLLIFLFIGAEFGLYVLLRQLVNTKEYLSACTFPNETPNIFILLGFSRER